MAYDAILTGRSLVTPPTEEPVTRALAIAHLREHSDTDQADYIDHLITLGREAIEQRTWRALCRQTWDFFYEGFPCGDTIALPLAPLIAVSSVSYKDAAGDTQTLSSLLYSVDTTSEPGRVRLNYGASWPITQSAAMQAVTIRAVCGYGSAANIPRKLMHAILITIGDAFEHREEIIVGTISSRIEGVIDALCADHMRPVIS